MRTWQIIIASSTEIVLLINTVLFLICLFKVAPIWKYFSMFLVFSLIIEISSHVIWSKNNPFGITNNLFLLHILTLGEFILLSLFYNQMYKEVSTWQKNAGLFVLIVSGLIVANSLFIQPLYKFNTNARTLSQAIIIAYAVGYYLQATNEKLGKFSKGINIINAGVLLYYTGSFFIFMFGNVLLGLEPRHNLFWLTNALLYLVFQLLVFTAAIWQFRQTKSTYS